MAIRSEVEEAADELYALSPREFTAARDARAKNAKDAGDKEAAAEIKALRKPTVTAWLANQLVRQHADEVRPLLELGSALREATATLSGPQLRELSRQRNEVVRALVRQARRLAADAGQPVSEDVARGLEETLNAALADPGQAELLLQGRLSVQLKHSGYGPADGPTSAAGKPPAAPAKARAAKSVPGRRQPTAAEQRRAERRDRLERELAEAWPAARAAADARSAAEQQAKQAVDEAKGIRRRVEGLRSELAAAEEELARATAASDQATEARDAAAAEADRATKRVSTVQRELEKG
jgi:hypothetical protein